MIVKQKGTMRVISFCVVLMAHVFAMFVVGDDHDITTTINLYVSPNVDGAHAPHSLHIGSKENPFRSLHAARDAIRQLTLQQRAGGVQVTVGTGVYEPLTLDTQDSGFSATHPIVWKGDSDSVVSAGVSIPGTMFREWNSTRGVYFANLSALGVTHYGNLSTADGGTGNLGCTHDRVALYFNTQPMVLARFPNAPPGALTWNFSVVDQGSSIGSFAISHKDPAASKLLHWQTVESNPWLHGYWMQSWDDAYVPLLTAVNTSNTNNNNGFVNVTIGGATGVKRGARFYGVNLLSELDAPGEYYIDDAHHVLYFFPPQSSPPPSHWPNHTVLISVNTSGITLVNVSNVVIHGLTVVGAIHTGIDGSAGVDSVHIVNCTVAGHGRHGIDLRGKHSGVASTLVHSVGGSGMRVVGGDAPTLTAGNMYAVDNHVHHVGYWKRTYQPALFWGGVSNTYARNLLEDGPAMCVWGGGNVADGVACTFDGNHVNNCVTETCDQGAFHTCGQSGNAFINRGNVMKNGVFTHMQPGPGVKTAQRGIPPICTGYQVGFYMDDEMSGWLVENNTFVDCNAAMLLGGGQDAIVRLNHVESCGMGLLFDNRGMTWESKTNCPLAIAALKKLLQGPYGKVYASRWPEISRMENKPPCVPSNDTIVNNTYAYTPTFCSASATAVSGWGSVLANNTDTTPAPLPCVLNTTKPTRPYRDCVFTVIVGWTEAGHTWPDATYNVHADIADCFRIDGCSSRMGPVGVSCERKYNLSARLLVTTNGTFVGEGCCCSPSVTQHVVSWTRSCPSLDLTSS